MADERLIPVVVSVDVEPDGVGHAPDGTWHSAAAVHDWITDLRARVEQRTGRPMRVAWYLRMDLQVAALFGSSTYGVEADPRLPAAVERHGDVWGLHTHGWRPEPGGGWVDDFREPWFGECVDHSYAAFAEAFGRPCRVQSFGNRFLSEAAVARLAHHGVEVDTTAEPANAPVPDGGWAHLRGAIPDYRRTPRRPYRLGPGLMELPLTAGRKDLGPDVRAHLSRRRRHGLRERLDHPVQLGGKPTPWAGFDELVRGSLRAQRRPYLAFAVRSDGVLDPVQRPRLDAHVDALLAMPEADRFVFVPAPEALRLLDAG